MKYFSLCYKLQEKDFQNYNKVITKAVFANKAKVIILPIFMIAAFMLFLNQSDPYSMILMICYIPVYIFMSVILNREFYKTIFKKSKMMKRDITLEFYDNHIEEKYLPDEYSSSQIERHYSFRDILSIIEAKENIFIMLNDNSMINIPKRSLSGENYAMIKNMINNLFSNKYQMM